MRRPVPGPFGYWMNCSLWKSSEGGRGTLGNSFVTVFRAFLAIFLLAGAFEASAQTFLYGTWAHNRVLVMNTTAGGANIASNLADFPVLIRLNSTVFNFNDALTGGADIRFEDPNG